MKKKSVYEKYREVVYNLEGIKDPDGFAKELARRHLRGWRIPDSTYQRKKDKLYYKDSLSRKSPYFVDLLKIEDLNNLKEILLDIHQTIRREF